VGEGRAEPEPAAPALSIEESLALLQRLRDRGLITDAEYDTKKGRCSTASDLRWGSKGGMDLTGGKNLSAGI
jgi:hypothetical protein